MVQGSVGSNFSLLQEYIPLSMLKEKKKYAQNIKNLSNPKIRFQIFEKIIEGLYQKEWAFVDELKQKESLSLFGFLNLLNEYKLKLMALQGLENDIFVVEALKQTNSLYKPVFLEAVLGMRKRLSNRVKSQQAQEIWSSTLSDFEKQIVNQPSFFKWYKDFSLYPFRLKTLPFKKAEEGKWHPFKLSQEDLEAMYCSLLELVQKKVDILKKQNQFNLVDFENNDLAFQSFFKELFQEVISIRNRFFYLAQKKEGGQEEAFLKQNVTAFFTALENQTETQKRFLFSLQKQDVLEMDRCWKKIKKETHENKELKKKYQDYFNFLIKQHLASPLCGADQIPLQVDSFLSILDAIVLFEKAYLKKLMKFILKNACIALTPYVSFQVIKTALKEMKNTLSKAIEMEERNLFLLYLFLKKENASACDNREGKTPLHLLVLQEEKSTKEKIKSLEVDINAIDLKGRTPLFLAVMQEKDQLVDLLLSLGADVEKSDYKGQTPVMKAFELGNKKVIDLLLKKKALLTGADSSFQTIAHFAILSQKPEILSFLKEYHLDLNRGDINQNTPLHLALQKNYFEGFKWLLKNGAHPYLLNKEGKSVVSLVQHKSKNFKEFLNTFENEKKVYECLLFQGILTSNLLYVSKAIEKKVQLREIYLYQKTPIELALTVLNREVISLLMKNKCFIPQKTTKNLGYFALKQALVQQDIKYFKLLVKAGADINSQEEETGQTLLHEALLLGYASFVKVLIENNADITIKNKEGKTPADLLKKIK